MANRLKINCKKVYKTAMEFDEINESYKNLLDKMKAVSNEIEEAWQGNDYQTFKNKFDNYIDSLNDVTIFFTNKSSAMKNTALKHGRLDNELKERIERSIINE